MRDNYEAVLKRFPKEEESPVGRAVEFLENLEVDVERIEIRVEANERNRR